MQNKLQKEYEYPSLCCVKIITEELESDNHSFTPNYSIFTFAFTFVINFGNKKDSIHFGVF
jgi:hypothetical protein